MMKVQSLALTTIMFASAACGDTGNNADAGRIDGGPDAAMIDAAVSDAGGPVGLWKLQSVSMRVPVDDGGMAMVTMNTTGSQIDGTETARASGTLELSPNGELAIGVYLVRGTQLWQSAIDGFLDSFTFGAGFGSIQSGHGGGIGATWTKSPPENLTLMNGNITAKFLRYSPTDNETIDLHGVASVPVNAATPLVPLVHPRVALIFLLRKAGGGVSYFEVPDGDKPLPGFGTMQGQSQSFDMSRTEGALGVERITYGATAFLAMALVVVYDDVNNDGTLNMLFGSCGAGQDCVRGISPIVLGYRIGQSTELAASQYAWMTKGWTWAIPAMDFRQSPIRLGLVSLMGAPDAPAMPADIVVANDPSTVVIPALNFD
jgi:hypothetical protein